MRFFISSTITDMQEERNAVTEVFQTLNHQVSRSEFFPAMSMSPEAACLAQASDCEVFVGIYKNRYGSIPPNDNPFGLSVTEMEYMTAEQNHRPRLVFIQSDDKGREPQLKEFLARIRDFRKGVYCKEYGNVDSLKFELLHALVFQLKTEISEEEFKTLAELADDSPYKGTVKWEMIDYEECEKMDCFSGIKIGAKSIYLKSPYQGQVRFLLFDNNKPMTEANCIVLSDREFHALIESIFSDNDIYWIEKDIWRTSS